MAKRSPILGYNHNVLYRGLVFHVQTEDSGLLSPHLFTHLFYGGTIISTRKLVYDAGSAEEAIKGLMQSQHKIVLKELKKGTFDDKIDVYLKDVEGLLPRFSTATAAAPAAEAPAETAVPQVEERPPSGRGLRSQTEELESLDAIEPPEMILADRPSEPVITIERDSVPAISRTATPPPIPTRAATPPPVPPRTITAERKSAPSRTNLAPPPPPSADEIDPPTDPDVDSGAIRMALNNATVRTPMVQLESGPEISIKLDLEDDGDQPIAARTRSRHDTDIEAIEQDSRASTQSDGVPMRGGESIPPLPAPPERPKTGDRSPSLGAAALPPVRPVTRPPSRQAISPPAVMSRPVADQDRSDAIEVYAPAPSSVEPPPGERAERPGQYAQHKRPSGKVPVDAIRGGERSGGVPVPAGLARPSRQSGGIPSIQAPRPQSPSSQPTAQRTQSPSSHPPVQARSPSQQSSVPRVNTPSQPPSDGIAKGRTPTPSRVSPPGSGPAARGSSSGGVVMTRPAVIVGAPAKPANPPRARKAREEEGRGFGQGLISEKSLDEVILAYLSEDADDK